MNKIDSKGLPIFQVLYDTQLSETTQDTGEYLTSADLTMISAGAGEYLTSADLTMISADA